MKRVLIIWTSFWATSLLFGDTVDQPNVLFISVDDLNDWIGCLEGHPQALTPNMDRLAERGVLFSNAHCAAPACNPSRAAVFSGMMPDKTGVWSNNTEAIDRAMPEALLLSQAFEKAGYATLGTGKLLHKNGKKFFQEYYETNQRWSPFDKNAVNYTAEELPTKGTDNPRHIAPLGKEEYVLPLNRMPSDRSPEDKKGESFDWGAFEVPDEAFGDTRITDWAIQKLKHHDGKKPLFL
ncbi:MAG: sulfatase-like hydrolase/transferase, partial [Verrucomicrobiota bacterium]